MSSPFIIIDELEEKMDEVNSGLSTSISNVKSVADSIKTVVDTIDTNTKANNAASSTGTLSQKLSYLITNNTSHGSQIYSTAGTYTWTCPAGVSMVLDRKSVV